MEHADYFCAKCGFGHVKCGCDKVQYYKMLDNAKKGFSENITLTHKCKSWSPFFQAIKKGIKTHDLRFDFDRNFKIGDIIRLEEYLPFEGRYTGDFVNVKVTYITSSKTPCAFSSAVLDKDYCILSIKVV